MKRSIIAISACCWLAAVPVPAQQASNPDQGAACPAVGTDKPTERKRPPRKDAKRVQALEALCARLGIGEGKVVADVGCGKGQDTMVFAGVVGDSGKVYGEEIGQDAVDALAAKARNSAVKHIVPVLGSSEDPRLPDGAIDLIYMHRVFHHFSKPSSMLDHFRADLKSGGYLVIVDGDRGPQRTWPEMASREKKHSFTGETTVVRLAREAGFRFQDEFDDLWPDQKLFVLVFCKPEVAPGPSGDPDLPAPLDGKAVVAKLPPVEADPPRVLFVGLDRGRALLPALRERDGPGSSVVDVLIEEWRIFEDELPSDVKEEEVMRTKQGDLPELAGNSLDAAVFADGYSRLWDPAPLLKRLRASLKPGAYVAILDRPGPEQERRPLAGHRRRISPDRVKADLQAAGFEFVKELTPAPQDRFMLLLKSP